MIIPYRSQEDADAHKYRNDCGPACVGMVLDYLGTHVTTDALSDQTTLAQHDTGLTCSQLAALLAKHNTVGAVIAASLSQITQWIDTDRPVIALINYATDPNRQNQPDRSGHFVVVTGYDANNIIVNDPDFWGSRRNEGNGHVVSRANFEQALATSPAPYEVVFIQSRGVMPVDALKTALTLSGDSLPVQITLNNIAYAATAQELRAALNVSLPSVASTTQVTTTGGLNLRNGPGTNYGSQGLLARGETLNVLNTPVVANSGYHWLFVTVQASGKTGYIAQEFTGAITPPPSNRPTPQQILGVHIVPGGSRDNLVAQANDLKAAGRAWGAVVVLNDVLLANALVPLSEFVVFRAQGENGWNQVPAIPNDATAAYAYGLARVAAFVAAFPTLNSGVYHQPDNEANEIDSLPADVVNAYHKGLLDGFEQRGLHYAALAYSVGHPTDEGQTAEKKWASLAPTLERLLIGGHVVVLHAYSAPGTPAGQLTDPNNRLNYEFRADRLYGIPGIAQPVLIFGEAACEFATGAFQGVQETVNWQSAFAIELSKRTYRALPCAWHFGNEEFAGSSIDSAASALVAFKKS